ncbi:hypothetical protein ACFLTK_02160 [Chloroflexota bacterium]
MAKLPRLKLKKPYSHPFEEIRDFEQVKYSLFGYGDSAIVHVEGQVINSYEELTRLVSQDCDRDKECLETLLFPTLRGGG